MDVTPEVPPDVPWGRQIITSYGDGLFRITGQAYAHPVLVTPEATLPWEVTSFAEMTLDSLRPLLERTPKVEVLLFGCGTRMAPVPPAIKEALREQGIASDPMDTGAAARTYNVLMTEGRRVGAALIPV